MSAIDLCGVLMLSYATSIAVWSLCLDLQPVAVAVAAERERPSSLPSVRR